MFCNEIGRKVHLVNFDFANDRLPYEVAIDVRRLITLQVVDFHSICLQYI
jgi:hypothetical protein